MGFSSCDNTVCSCCILGLFSVLLCILVQNVVVAMLIARAVAKSYISLQCAVAPAGPKMILMLIL